MSEVVRRQVRFIGRVQGVGFRATTKSIARQHTVTGWVRNEDDGSVLLEAQGAPAAIQEFLAQVQQALGRFITSHTEVEVQIVPQEKDFGIRR